MNQDYVFTSEVPVGALPNLFMVADGMGGYKAGEYASKNTIDTIVNEIMLSEERRPVRLIGNAVQTANRMIRTKSVSDENYKGMGTTLCLSYFDGKQLCVANIGDSRLYLIGDTMREIIHWLKRWFVWEVSKDPKLDYIQTRILLQEL